MMMDHDRQVLFQIQRRHNHGGDNMYVEISLFSEEA